MEKFFNALKDLYKGTINGKTYEEIYYSKAVDVVDLEYRMRLVQRGEAPFQKRTF